MMYTDFQKILLGKTQMHGDAGLGLFCACVVVLHLVSLFVHISSSFSFCGGFRISDLNLWGLLPILQMQTWL